MNSSIVITTVALATSVAASLAVRILRGLDVKPSLYIVDSLKASIEEVKAARNPRCPTCSLTEPGQRAQLTSTGASRCT